MMTTQAASDQLTSLFQKIKLILYWKVIELVIHIAPIYLHVLHINCGFKNLNQCMSDIQAMNI